MGRCHWEWACGEVSEDKHEKRGVFWNVRVIADDRQQGLCRFVPKMAHSSVWTI